MVNVCEICGVQGFTNKLAICDNCGVGAEHTYCCMVVELEDVPERWSCNDCVEMGEGGFRKQNDLSTQKSSVTYNAKIGSQVSNNFSAHPHDSASNQVGGGKLHYLILRQLQAHFTTDASGEQSQRSCNHPYPTQSTAPYSTAPREGYSPWTRRRSRSRIQSHKLLHPIDLATASFDRIPPRKRNRYSWNKILSGYSKSKNHCESLRLYNRMRRDCDGVVASFNLVFAIKACVGLGVLENGVLIHGLAMKNGLDKDAYVAPSLVEMYGEFGRMEDAQKVFDEITLRSSVLWGVLMKGYLRYSRDSEVFRLFYLMREAGLGVDNALTLICLVKACGNVFAGKEGKSVHGLSIRRGFIDRSCYLQASVVDMYVKCRLLDNAREMFETSVDKNVVMWTTLVSGFAKCERAVEAFDLFRQMLRESVLPNQCTLAALLVSCSSLGTQRHGRSVHGYMIRNEIEMDAVNFTSFIDMYARCGNIRMARKVFDMMPERNVISWSSMINAFGINGMLEEALDCFGKMKSRNLTPNSATYVLLLSACSHSGNIEEGRKQFASMTSDYGIAPEEEHYACMVDLLGRDGEVGEAKSFIDNMPVKPMASAWGALLNACRIHKNVDLAEEIAEKLLSMGSNESSVYVLLSNIYADAGMWEMVNSVRSKMGMKGYTKSMGLSAIGVA